MNHDRERLERKLVELQAELDEASNLDPPLRERLEQTLADLRQTLAAEPSEESPEDTGFIQRLTESARHFEETHPNLSGMIGSVIDALGRMGI